MQRPTRKFTMLSRTADSLFWMARYMERAEFLARTIEAAQRLSALPTAYNEHGTEWESALESSGVSGRLPPQKYETGAEADSGRSTSSPSTPRNPSSIRNCIESAPHQRPRGPDRADGGDVGGRSTAPGWS